MITGQTKKRHKRNKETKTEYTKDTLWTLNSHNYENEHARKIWLHEVQLKKGWGREGSHNTSEYMLLYYIDWERNTPCNNF